LAALGHASTVSSLIPFESEDTKHLAARRLMSNFRVDVSRDVLVWARRSSGLSLEDAAEKLKVLVTELRMWEEGAEEPTLADLRTLARVYKYPLAVMLLPTPPTGIDVLRDFRLLPENQGRDWSPALRRQFRRLRYQQQVARELAVTTEEPPPTIDVHIAVNESPEDVGSTIRSWLEPKDIEAPVKEERAGLPQWITRIEAKGILVTQIEGVSLEEMRGCSISDRPYPIIALNGKDAQTGKLFTLVHELAHVLLNEEALCDLADGRSAKPTAVERVEHFCNRVSAAVLMPAEALLVDPAVQSAHRLTEWSDAELLRLATQFEVSMEALLLRLVTLGKASMDFYWQRRPIFVALYRQLRETREAKLKEATGGPSPYLMKIRNLGRRYVTDVLDAYDRDLIDPSDVSDFLDIKVNNLPKLVAHLAS
jgi:Zn-dependent peptidase ImmA (M78 family)/DNA-binding transcriptional regulator YiaG